MIDKLLQEVLISMRKKPNEDPESIALGSPLFVRVVGAVILSMVSWIGYTTYNNSLQMGTLQQSVNSFQVHLDKIADNQYTRAEAVKESLSTSAKVSELELRIRALEDRVAKVGGPSDPWFTTIESLKKEISGVNEKLTKIETGIEALKNKP